MSTKNPAHCWKMLKPKILLGNKSEDETMHNQQVTLAELGWLAGIIDGEGWLGLSISLDDRSVARRTAVIKTELKINNTDKEIIEKAAMIFKKLGVNPYRRQIKQSTPKKLVSEVSTKNMTGVLNILNSVIPYLTGNKLARAKLIREFIKLRERSGTIEIPEHLYNGNGPRRLVAPYNQREIEIVEECRRLQARGTSTTTRRKRDKAVEKFKIRNQKYLERLTDTR